jgi:uncharacterized protein YheU (UPF0270 family)
MRIPYTELSDDALHGIIEEYVSREGTEYGSRDFSLEEKVEQVLAQIHGGDVIIEFDAESQSCQLLKLNID